MARGLEGGRVYFADPALRAHDVGERESVPVAIGVFGFMQGGIGVDGSPVAAVVGGDVGAVGAYGDPEFLTLSMPRRLAVVWESSMFPLSLSLDGQAKDENNDGGGHERMVTDGGVAGLTTSGWVLHRCTSPLYLSPKVFERKYLSPDFGLKSDNEKARLMPGLLVFF